MKLTLVTPRLREATVGFALWELDNIVLWKLHKKYTKKKDKRDSILQQKIKFCEIIQICKGQFVDKNLLVHGDIILCEAKKKTLPICTI